MWFSFLVFPTYLSIYLSTDSLQQVSQQLTKGENRGNERTDSVSFTVDGTAEYDVDGTDNNRDHVKTRTDSSIRDNDSGSPISSSGSWEEGEGSKVGRLLYATSKHLLVLIENDKFSEKTGKDAGFPPPANGGNRKSKNQQRSFSTATVETTETSTRDPNRDNNTTKGGEKVPRVLRFVNRVWSKLTRKT